MALVIAFYTTTAFLKMAAQSRRQDVDKILYAADNLQTIFRIGP